MCGQLKKSHIPIIIGCVFSFFNRLLYLVKDAILFKHPLISNTSCAIIWIFTFIPLLILNIQKKSVEGKDNTKILLYNCNKKITKEKIIKILYIFLSAITYFVQGIIFANCLQVKSNLWILEIAFISSFSHLILKFKPQIHHFISVITIIVLEIVLDLVSENLQKELTNQLFLLIMKYIREVIYSFHETINKYAMERKYYSVYEICFYNGLINTILLIIFSVISYYYFLMDDFDEYFNNFTTTELLVLLGYVSTHTGLFLCCLITNRDNSPCHIFIIYVFGYLSSYLINITTNFSASAIIVIICRIIILFMSLIFNELIELNFYHLNKGTSRSIRLRLGSEFFNECSREETIDKVEIDTKEEGILIELKTNSSN